MNAPISGPGSQRIDRAAPLEAPDDAPAPAAQAEAAAPPASQAQTTLRAGSVGMSVAALQAKLGAFDDAARAIENAAPGIGAIARAGGGAFAGAAQAIENAAPGIGAIAGRTVDGHGTGVDIPGKGGKVDGHGTGVDVPATTPGTVDGHGTGVDVPAERARPEGYETLDAARAGQYLRSGSSGESTKALQRALKQAGLDVPETGAFDAKTKEAVLKFQRENGCAVDGVVGPETLGALDRKLGIAGPGGATPASGGGTTPTSGGGTPGAPPAPSTGPTGPSTEPQGPPSTPAGPPGTPTRPGAPSGPEGPSPTSGPDAPAPSGAAGSLDALPARPAGAETGSAFIERTKGMSRAQREEAILAEIEKGNVPDFLRDLKPVTVNFTGADGKPHTATYKVMPDYLAIGSNDDFVRMPMSPLTAQKIADKLGCSLPTSKMVDDIYAQADRKIAPSPQPAGPQMMSNDYYMRHQQTIERQLGGNHDGLIAGNKKDLVLSNKLAEKPGSVAIYGWHQPNGKPIQGTSTVHENTYADYSHGTRLVSGTVMVDGKPMALADLLRDPNLSRGLSSEGPLRVTRQPGV